MGYTNYWYRTADLDQKTFAKAAKDCKKVIEALQKKGLSLQRSYDDGGKPVFTKDLVAFNGTKSESYEDFGISRVFGGHAQTDDHGLVFEFTKTDQKPYDEAVRAALVIFRHHFGDNFVVTSDAERLPDGFKTAPTNQKWLDTVALVKAHCGFVTEFIFGRSTDPVYVPDKPAEVPADKPAAVPEADRSSSLLSEQPPVVRLALKRIVNLKALLAEVADHFDGTWMADPECAPKLAGLLARCREASKPEEVQT